MFVITKENLRFYVRFWICVKGRWANVGQRWRQKRRNRGRAIWAGGERAGAGVTGCWSFTNWTAEWSHYTTSFNETSRLLGCLSSFIKNAIFLWISRHYFTHSEISKILSFSRFINQRYINLDNTYKLSSVEISISLFSEVGFLALLVLKILQAISKVLIRWKKIVLNFCAGYASGRYSIINGLIQKCRAVPLFELTCLLLSYFICVVF